MSNLCRRFRTTFRVPSAKPLIQQAAGAVAEGRQLCRNENHGAPIVTVVAKATRSGRARVNLAAVRQACSASVASRGPTPRNAPGKAGQMLVSRGFDNAYCRSFSTLHRHPCLFYTRPTLVCGQLWTDSSCPQALANRGTAWAAAANDLSAVCDGVNGKRPESQST